MVNLPHWVIPDKLPALYDLESATTIEMVAKLYGSMQTLINEYNEYVANLDKSLITFETDLLKANDDFKTLMETFVNNFIKCCDIRIDKQDAQIAGAINEIIKTAQSVTEKAIEEGKVLTDATARENIEIINRELSTLENRMNAFTQLEEGSTTGDAELIDARIDYTGVTHENVGTHIREVSSQLSSEIDNLINTDSSHITMEWVQGALNLGVYEPTITDRICTKDYIPSVPTYIDTQGYDIGFVVYDDNNEFIIALAWYKGIIDIADTLSEYYGNKIKLVARYNNNTISPKVGENIILRYPLGDMIENTVKDHVNETNIIVNSHTTLFNTLFGVSSKVEYEVGGIDTSGNDIDNTQRIRSNFIPKSTIKIRSISSALSFVPMIYDNDGNYINTTASFVSEIIMSDLYSEFGNDINVRLVVRTANGVITPSYSCFIQVIKISDLINQNGFWSDKSVLHIGTSISDETVVKNGYYVNRWVQNGLALNGCYDYHNTAISSKGAIYFAENYETLIRPYIADTYLLTIEHGENDRGRWGTEDKMNPDSNGNYDITTAYGAMAYIINEARKDNMYIKIGLVTSWFRDSDDESEVLKVAQKFNLPILETKKLVGSSDQEITTTLTLQDGNVVSGTQSIIRWYSTYIGLTVGDGVHPYNPLTQEKLASIYAHWVNTL